MNDVAIRVENLSKQYRIGRRESYQTLRDSFTEACTAPFRRLRSLFRGSAGPGESNSQELFWALQDVSFEVKQGEVVGIIGRNGAGKSTLLKILSRITEPTKGYIEIKGRTASLLEVGTGFHQELTGRENIYLNGAILGMRKAEIDRKFDEIVAFSEVEKFIDTPVKFYSSGMYVRLAFAVAAHLEPDILLVDEVLAVGDAAFQKKCLGKMGDVAKEGRTVLFVSHNMGAVIDLCTRAYEINSGSIVHEGAPNEVIKAYLRGSSYLRRIVFDQGKLENPSKSDCRFVYAETKNNEGSLCSVFEYGEHIIVEIGVESELPDQRVIIGVGIRDSLSRQIFHFNNRDDNFPLVLKKGLSRVQMNFANILNKDDYYVTLWLGDERLNTQDYVTDCLRFSADTSTIGNSLARGQVIQPGYWVNLSE